MQYRRFLAAALVTGAAHAAPAALAAQYIPARTVTRGFEFALSNGEPISFFLEHAGELQLTDEQRESLISIRRRLRRVNGPYYRQLDSLRNEVGLDLEPKPRLTDRDRQALARFQTLSRPVADSMRVNNDAARAEAWALLEEAQRVRADSIVKADGGRDGRGGGRPSGR
jgi:hypothetical protein